MTEALGVKTGHSGTSSWYTKSNRANMENWWLSYIWPKACFKLIDVIHLNKKLNKSNWKLALK